VDTLIGGTGGDTFSVNDANDMVWDSLGGTDTLNVNGTTSFNMASNAWGVENVVHSAIGAVTLSAKGLADPEDVFFVEQLVHRYEGKLELLEGDSENANLRATHITLRRHLRLAAIRAERERLHELHAADAINDETLRTIEAELDERELISSTSVNRG